MIIHGIANICSACLLHINLFSYPSIQNPLKIQLTLAACIICKTQYKVALSNSYLFKIFAMVIDINS